MTGPFYGWIILLSFLWDGQCHHQRPAPKENGQRLAAGGTGGWITAALRGGIPRDNGDGGGGPGLGGGGWGRGGDGGAVSCWGTRSYTPLSLRI